MNQVAPLASQSTNSVTEQKLARLDSFTHLLIRDVRSMVDVRIVMDAANTILLNQQGAGIIGGATINVVQQSLAQSLSLALARIFDATEGKSLADQDKASVPVLVDLIGDADVQALLTKRIRECFPANADECETIVTAALQGALGVYDGLLAGAGAQALKSVKEYRNLRMAHMLFHREPQSVPLFGELFLLADAAREFGLHVQRMVTGGRYEWDDEEWELARHAGVFWRRAMPEFGTEPITT